MGLFTVIIDDEDVSLRWYSETYGSLPCLPCLPEADADEPEPHLSFSGMYDRSWIDLLYFNGLLWPTYVNKHDQIYAVTTKKKLF